MLEVSGLILILTFIGTSAKRRGGIGSFWVLVGYGGYLFFRVMLYPKIGTLFLAPSLSWLVIIWLCTFLFIPPKKPESSSDSKSNAAHQDQCSNEKHTQQNANWLGNSQPFKPLVQSK